MGKWVPIHSDEYDGELPVETGREHEVKNGDGGVVVFNGDSLPWAAGQYELRYHHDGKHNVMSNVGQVEIFGKLSDPYPSAKADHQSTSPEMDRTPQRDQQS
jgi:phosphatidylethanolamine N-methyltransferase